MVNAGEMFRTALRHKLEERGRGSQEALAATSGVRQNTISEIKSGKYFGKRDVQEKIAKGLGYDLVDFLALGRSLLGNAEPMPLGELVPVVVFDANCGGGVGWTDAGLPVGEGLATVELPRAWVHENSYALRIHNDSMEPTLREGDIVLVDCHLAVEPGDVVFVRLPGGGAAPGKGDALVKRFRRSGDTIILESDNRAYAPIVLTRENSRGVRIMAVTRMIRKMV